MILPSKHSHGAVWNEGDEAMIYANVGPDGVIVFEPHADLGLARLPVGHANNRDAKKFKDIVSVNARHAYDGVTLLVPGMPEAADQNEALDKLLWFRRLIEMRMNGERGWPPVASREPAMSVQVNAVPFNVSRTMQ